MFIVCGGMHRSGSTLQYQIVSHLVEYARIGKRVGWCGSKEGIFDDKSSDVECLVYKSHILTKEMRYQHDKNNLIAFYTYRDIRNVVGSRMRHASTTFDAILGEGFIDECLHDFREWTSLDDVYVSRYEEFTNDIYGETSSIAEHMGISVPDSELKKIQESYSLENQQKRVDLVKQRDCEVINTPKNQVYDKSTLLHSNHITKGSTSGSIDESLSAYQVAYIENKYRTWLIDNSYKLSHPKIRLVERLYLLKKSLFNG